MNEMSNEIFEKLKQLIVESLGVDPDQVVPDARFREDMGVNSSDIEDLFIEIDVEMGVDIYNAEATKFETVKDILSYIETLERANDTEANDIFFKQRIANATSNEKLDIVREMSSLPSDIVSIEVIKDAIRGIDIKEIDKIDTCLLTWKDDSEILQILLKSLDRTKSLYLAKGLLSLDDPTVDGHIMSAGYDIEEHEVDGYGINVRHLEKNGVRI